MKTKITFVFAFVAWATVITQYILMIQNSVDSVAVTTVRFFSFFTILTNSLVALYMTLSLWQRPRKIAAICNAPGTLTAVTSYIFIVGLVYQLLLRHLWEPKGLQRVVDELLHTVIPMVVVIFWYVYENKRQVGYRQILNWLLYPLFYVCWILIRGTIVQEYPYPFVNVMDLGLKTVLYNCLGLFLTFSFVSVVFVKLGKQLSKAKN